jgi:hypothetical protein
MKTPHASAKRGRKPKVTRTIKIEVHPKAYDWFEALCSRGPFGASIEDVVVNLLNDRLKQLLEKGEIVETPALAGAIPFPNQAEQNRPPHKTVAT